MPRLHSRSELAALSEATARNYDCIEYLDNIYIPIDYVTKQYNPVTADRTIWRRFTSRELMEFANDIGVLFYSDGEFRSFQLMLQQFSRKEKPLQHLLVPTKDGIQMLDDKGQLRSVTGAFVPNYLNVVYDPEVDTTEMWATLIKWVADEEQAHSLLYHLSLMLQPSWTAGKYLLLIGKLGRNGKSTLLQMLASLIGQDNASSVKQQDMATKRPTVAALNGSLINIVLDGPKEFVKDSSVEKSLIVGEWVDLEFKYSNIPVRVQTRALFVEGLNDEPVSSDHSSALQKRIVRYYFPLEFEEDTIFEAHMQTEKMLNALLKLMLQHWVTKESAKKVLVKTDKSLQLQLEHQWSTSPLMQFLEYLGSRDRDSLREVVQKDALVGNLIALYRPWLEENGYRNYEESLIKKTIEENFVTTRKTKRIAGKPTTQRVLVSPRDSVAGLLVEMLREDE